MPNYSDADRLSRCHAKTQTPKPGVSLTIPRATMMQSAMAGSKKTGMSSTVMNPTSTITFREVYVSGA